MVGIDPAAVRLVSVKENGSPIPKEAELKARKLASRVFFTLSDTPPKVLTAENVALLIFERYPGEPGEPGPTVVLMNDKMFLLKRSLHLC